MKIVTIHDAKTNLSKLIEEACQGEEVVIARGAKPVVRLVPIADVKGRRKHGALRGKFQIDPSFFEPLSEEELADWE
jgi:prevent-host-death family protein